MITVTFDSNVWEKIVDEDKRSENAVYQYIYNKINNGTIKPFFFEGLATMENIKKIDRKLFFGNFKASIQFQVDDESPHVIEGIAAPELSEYLRKTIPKALDMGFKFIHTPRIGAHSLNIAEQYKASDDKYLLSERLKRTSDCIRFIESLGAGKANIHNKLDEDNIKGIVHQTKQDKSLNNKNYAKGIAEWVDGDAVAAHYAFGIDYFCTNDQAKGAGITSIFHPTNLYKLTEKYEIKFINPIDILDIL